MEYWLSTSPWPGVLLWMILYTSDYYLTIYSARGFREIGHFQFEGSFELTPQYQKDVDALNPVSKRHLVLLVLLSVLVYVLWWVFVDLVSLPRIYELYLGMFLLIEVAVHLRHLRNIFLIREIRRHGGVDGQITYRKWFSYRVSAFEVNLFGALFLIIALLGFSTFFFGGAIICFATGFRHNQLAKKAKALPSPTVTTQS